MWWWIWELTFRHVDNFNEKKESLTNEAKLTNRGIIFMLYYIFFVSGHIQRHCICSDLPASYICFTKSFTGPQLSYSHRDLWDFGVAIGVGLSVSPSGRAVTFNSISQKDKVSPSLLSIFRLCPRLRVQRLLQRNPESWDTHHLRLPLWRSHATPMCQAEGSPCARLKPSSPRLWPPPLVNSIHVPRSVVLSTGVVQLAILCN